MPVAILPEALLQSLRDVPQFDREAFIAVHEREEKVTSIRINLAKFAAEDITNICHSATDSRPLTTNSVPWSPYGFYLSQRPAFTFDPLFHAGCYYVQEASSMFVEQALKQSVDVSQPLKVLDLCAAPGGKSTHLQSLISHDSLLVSNEVIKSRAAVLRQNIVKWGGANVIVTNNDPQHFQRLQHFFDVIVVDAPCSGSGLARRDPQAINEWSEAAVQLCCGRQKRILADALPCLKEGGLLVYSTCSYSVEEDESIGDWLIENQAMQSSRLCVTEDWNIVETMSEKGAYGYRFFPDKLMGEGFYLACFTKKSGGKEGQYKMGKGEKAATSEKLVVLPWLKGDLEILKEHILYALPQTLLQDFLCVKGSLYIQHAGVPLGEVMKGRLVPDHALALNTILQTDIPDTSLSYEQAIRYLQRLDLSLDAAQKGWQTVTFLGHNLGWINALPGRINNYYPKEWRILKQ